VTQGAYAARLFRLKEAASHELRAVSNPEGLVRARRSGCEARSREITRAVVAPAALVWLSKENVQEDPDRQSRGDRPAHHLRLQGAGHPYGCDLQRG